MSLTTLRRDRAGRAARAVVMAVAAAAVLGGWLAAAPTGASPDDDYHLTSIWCARGFEDGVCLPNPAGPWDRQTFVPFPVARMSCTAYQPEISAACQDEVLARDPRELTLGIGGNVGGERAGLYYWVAHTLVSDDHPRAFLSIRIMNAALALAMTLATIALAAPALRRTVALTWLLVAPPLGLFLVTSVNSSAWGLAGLGTAWANLLTALAPGPRWRKGAAAALALVGATIAVGARTEALPHLALGSVVVTALHLARAGDGRRRRARVGGSNLLIAGSLVGLIAAAALALPTDDYLTKLVVEFGEGVAQVADRQLGDPWLLVVSEVPQLWTGALGDRWGLGWLDTPMPALTWVATTSAFAALLALGLRRAHPLRVTAALVTVAGLMLLPTISLLAEGLLVGEQFQPRHYMAALFLLVGAAVLPDARSSGLELARGSRATLAIGLAIAHAAALHVNIQRYAVGLRPPRRFDLGADVQWWVAPIPPMTTWLLASAAFAVLAWLVLGLFVAAELDRTSAQPTSEVAPARPTE